MQPGGIRTRAATGLLSGADGRAEPRTAAIEELLEREASKGLLRFSTAGSVDDGKSTLIGRLLYDSKGVYEDQILSVERSSAGRNAGPIDFSLLTDGLKAEREQGITIDVAYRYFSTPKRKFIIADTPGHEQYTRNMATGSSTADLAIVLVDARKGVLPQSRRHACIAWLLGIPHVLVAVNKMDLVDFRADVFERIEEEFGAFLARLGARQTRFIPISALEGDNVVSGSARTPWYRGPCLLEHLENVPVGRTAANAFRFPVQNVIRPSLDFRGYGGQVASGSIRPGDVVMALPSGRATRVKSIPSYDGDLESASARMSVTLTLEDDIDLGRGDMLVDPRAIPHVSRRMEATLVWMNSEPLDGSRTYLLKHATQQVAATLKPRDRLDVETLDRNAAEALNLNEIGTVEVEAHRPLFFDDYRRNRVTGSFIVIDPISNATAAAGMIRERVADGTRTGSLSGIEFETSRVTAGERIARAGHQPATVWLAARRDLAYLLERRLFDSGCQVHVLADEAENGLLPDLARVLNAAGCIAICSSDAGGIERAREVIGVGRLLEIAPDELDPRDENASEQILRMLEQGGFIRRLDRFAGGDGI